MSNVNVPPGLQGLQTTLAGRNLFAFLPLITGPLLDNARIGAFGVACVNRMVNIADTALAIQLGRVPNGYLVYRTPVGGGLGDPTSGTTLWTASQIVLAAAVPGLYSFIVL